MASKNFNGRPSGRMGGRYLLAGYFNFVTEVNLYWGKISRGKLGEHIRVAERQEANDRCQEDAVLQCEPE